MSLLATEELHSPLQTSSQSGCFVCGENNPHGLRMRFERDASGNITASWRPKPAWEGYRGIVHGGIVSAVLDEVMSKSVAAAGAEAFTAELRVRFRRNVTTGDVFQLRGWTVKRHKRLFETEATLTAADGTEHAHAWGRFLTAPEVNA